MTHKVLHVVSNRWNSAIAEYAISACRATSMAGFDTCVSPLTGSPLAQRAIAAGLLTSPLDRFSLGGIFQARKLLEEFKPNVIFVYGGPEAVLMAAASGGQIPLVRFRGYGLDQSGFISTLTHDMSQIGVKIILAPSEFVAEPLRKISNLQVTVVPLGIDEEFFVPRKVLADADRPSLLIFGRFDPVKGHREFMKIMALVKREWPHELGRSPVLNIVGRPANLSVTHLREACLDVGLDWDQDVVVRAGNVDDVPILLSRQTLGVVSSLGSEYICRVAQEFLFCGTPVIVSGAGSLNEVLVDPDFGASYLGQDVQGAAQIISLRLQSHFRESLETRLARSRRAKDVFSLGRMAERLTPVISAVMGDK